MGLSVVINTKNSAETLRRALQSVAFADELIVVEMESTDETLSIAREFNARTFQHQDVGYVEPARNFALDQAKQDWILVLDDDEEVSSGLHQQVESVVNGSVTKALKADVYWLPRQNIVFNRWVK